MTSHGTRKLAASEKHHQLSLFLYHLPSPNASSSAFTAPLNKANGESPSTLLSISSSYSPNNLMMQSLNLQAAVPPVSSYFTKMEQPQLTTSTSINNNGHLEELDLELCLGHNPTLHNS
ncbi:hypothetical protein SESBI_44661 [Sesbania bispinosa]|nr:hypothetical protein SESBI_44661 [Sesbania bispinosa]